MDTISDKLNIGDIDVYKLIFDIAEEGIMIIDVNDKIIFLMTG
jgi:hypothetical protein